MTESGVPVRLGSRALAILIALVERAGELVTVDELLTKAWPAAVVEEVTLRVHLHALKKVLGDGSESGRYIVNEMGRGYRFVAPVTTIAHHEPQHAFLLAAGSLPAQITRVVGRDTAVGDLCELILLRRLLTVVGPGGAGKTTVALAVAERLRSGFIDDVHFVDLSTLNDPRFVVHAIASQLGFSLPPIDELAALVRYLAAKRCLLVLDNCEHLIEAVAGITQALYLGAHDIHILCTSREPIRAQGEWIYRLNGLALPPNDDVTVSEALKFGAIQLFAERLAESQDGFELTTNNLRSVCRICGRLDGSPLALEMAAATVPYFSLPQFVELLEDRFAVLAKGKRTAAPRQQTMRATIAWSHGLLSPEERLLFRRLAIFRSVFDLQSAIQCCRCPVLSATAITEAIGSLTAKSLLQADISGETASFRLLESTRAYAQEHLSLTDEGTWLSQNHAQLMYDRLSQAADEWRTLPTLEWCARYGYLIDDIRAAIDWALEPDGDVDLGIAITNLTGSLAYELSMLSEFLVRFEKAFALLATRKRNPVIELQLATNLARLIFHVGGAHDRATRLVYHALDIADELGSNVHTMEAMAGLWVAGLSIADYAAMGRASNAVENLAKLSDDRVAGHYAVRMSAMANAFGGHYERAEQLAQIALDEPTSHVVLTYHAPLSMDRKLNCSIARGRSLFMQGKFHAAIDLAEQMTDFVSGIDHRIPLLVVVGLLACPIAFWSRDWRRVEKLLIKFERHIDRYSAPYFKDQWARGFRQALCLSIGETVFDPIADIDSMHALPHDHLCAIHHSFVTPKAVTRALSGQAGWATAEILRVEGNRLLSVGAMKEGEALLRQAVDLARHQRALFWEIRATTDLASHMRETGRYAEASAFLKPVCAAAASIPRINDVCPEIGRWASLEKRVS